MPTSRISGNQIENTTSATITGLSFNGQSGALKLPTGNGTTQRPQNPVVGLIRFNTDEDRLEQYVNVATNSQPGWVKVKGGGASSGLGSYGLIKGNARTIVETGLEKNTLDTGGLASKIGPQWTNIGSSDGLGEYNIIRGNSRSIDQNLTISFNPSIGDYAFENAFSVGPIITVSSGYTLTIANGILG